MSKKKPDKESSPQGATGSTGGLALESRVSPAPAVLLPVTVEATPKCMGD